MRHEGTTRVSPTPPRGASLVYPDGGMRLGLNARGYTASRLHGLRNFSAPLCAKRLEIRALAGLSAWSGAIRGGPLSASRSGQAVRRPRERS